MDSRAIDRWERCVRRIEHQRQIGAGEQYRFGAVARPQRIGKGNEPPSIVGADDSGFRQLGVSGVDEVDLRVVRPHRLKALRRP